MFNLYRVTSFLQSVPSLTANHNLQNSPHKGEMHEPLLASPKKDKLKSPDRKDKSSKGKESKEKKKDDNDD
jgi:hypothetical protein